MNVYRPLGITILAIILIIAAALIIIVGTILVNSVLPSQYAEIALSQGITMYLIKADLFAPYILTVVGSEQNDINLWYGVFGCFIVYSGLYITSGIGLLYMKNWGRILAMIIGVISIITGIFLFLTMSLFGLLIGILFLALGLATVVYLAGDVKYEFQ
ncbi:MAG: DUF2127 domain-containing protein [Candidatus Lokiarchaeia archaeon]